MPSRARKAGVCALIFGAMALSWHWISFDAGAPASSTAQAANASHRAPVHVPPTAPITANIVKGHEGSAKGIQTPAPNGIVLPNERAGRVQAIVLGILSTDVLARRQLQFESVQCKLEGACQMGLRIPPQAPTAKSRDVSVAEDLMTAMSDHPELKGWGVSLTLIDHQPTGMAVAFSLSPPGTESKRLYSPSEIAEIRSQTLRDFLEKEGVEKFKTP